MKRAAILFLAAVMSIGMTGCGSGRNNSASSEAYATADGAPISLPLQEKATLKFLTQSSPLAPEEPNEKLIWQRLEEDTNVHIDWTNYTWDVFAEKKSLAIASGDLPDAIFDAAMSDYELLKYAKDGVIIPVEELVDQYMPNLKAIYDAHPEYRKFVTAPDGHIYSFPWIEELGSGKESIHSIDAIPWINQVWLKNLGLEMPTTIDQLTDVLRAFKTQDANGNGDPNDEIPMSFIYGSGGESLVSLLGAFGFGDNWDHTVVDNDGKVVFTMSQEGYKEGVQWLAQLYAEGLIDPEVFTQDWNTFVAKGANHLYGIYSTWDMGNVTGFNSGDYSEPEKITADYAALPALEGPSGWKNITRTNGFGLDRGRMVITSANRNLELTARWIDKLYEPLQSAQNNWGTYGDEAQKNIFEMNPEGTFLSHLPLGDTSPWELRQKTFVGGPLAVLDSHYGTHITKPDDAAWRLDLLQEVYVKDMQMDNNYPRVFYTQEDQLTLTNIETVMFEHAMTKRAEWIQNGKIAEEWDGYLKDLETMGLSEWLRIKQTYYDEFNQQ
ncbi:extracellular solute-binding protein [Anaerotalea alkaliphila]|nr:extracellular solute-binding protein [Anaerotalea alkaliphila]